MPDLLIELFSEEIPARMQTRAADNLKRLVTDGLVEAGLSYAAAAPFSTPRRLTLSIEGLSGASRAVREERRGPKADAPDNAIEGFLRSTGLSRDQLETRADKKGEVLYAVIERPGRSAADIVAEVLDRTIRNFPWPKSMRWGAGSLRWVRPLQSILCILADESGAQVVPMELDGIVAGDVTRGHRFMATDPFSVVSFNDYEAKLKQAFVILRADERADLIWHDATNQAFANGFEVVEDKGLLAEVAGLVEWPVVLSGPIDEAFLDLPPEVLQTSMKEHQKFFSVRNPKTGRIERFVTVANIETQDQGATILAGNGKVLAARLSDAKFFWENDLRVVRETGLEGMASGLADVTFHRKLGSQADRVARIEALAREIAPMVGAKPDLAAEAARVCKADLQSEMVGEFPELQGLMGRYYAQAAGHDDGVPEACEEHYKPLGPGDAVPTNPVSIAVALADKIDTLTGFWAIDEKPTGSKDPYALRRAALGVVRLVLTNGLRMPMFKTMHVSLGEVYRQSRTIRKNAISAIIDDVDQKMRTWEQLIGRHPRADVEADAMSSNIKSLQKEISDIDSELLEKSGIESQVGRMCDNLLSFLHDRLKVHLKDEGIRHDVIDACLAMPGNDDLTLLVKRATALSDFLNTEDGENLLQGFKRANNILTQAEEADGVEYSFGADPKFAETPEEKALFGALARASDQLGPATEAEDFGAAMAVMADLRAPIDAFFEAVQVNSDNSVLRRNRLNLLSQIRGICSGVADLTRIEG